MAKVGQQIAALPLRWTAKGQIKVLMVTSRDTGRWVMPKGWEMDGKKPWAAAEIEALEEAGAAGYISKKVLGQYCYAKMLANGDALPCVVQVYPMVVSELLRNWKERDQRRRKWFSLGGAARRVDEAELSDLLNKLQQDPQILHTLRKDAGRKR